MSRAPFTAREPWVCDNCRLGVCRQCIDTLRLKVWRDKELLCKCKKQNHQLEALAGLVVDALSEKDSL